MSRNMQVLHVFEEDEPSWQAEHLEFWFGYPDPADRASQVDASVLCYCGGKLVPLKRNVKDASDVIVGAIWHLDKFDPEVWLPPEFQQFFNENWRDVPEGEDDDFLFGSVDE